MQGISLKHISFSNRIVRSATVDPYGNPDGTVSQTEIDLYRQYAQNHIGLIISAQAYVSKYGISAPGQNALYEDKFIEGHKKLVDAVHEAGGKIILQFSHAGAGACPIEGVVPVAPSPIQSPYSKEMPRELTVAEIKELVQDYIDCAVRGKQAGYDGLQLHCAHGYLLSQFISPVYNKRTDQYGGSIENRFRMSEEIIAGIREKLGEDYPIFIKLNSNTETGDQEEYFQDMVYIANKCKELGVEAIEISGFNFTKLGREGNHTYYLDRAARLRKETGIPVILVGGIRDFADMDKVLDAGVDMVSMSRPFICEPDLVTRLINGQEKATCISCSKCFYLYNKEGRRCVFHKKPGE